MLLGCFFAGLLVPIIIVWINAKFGLWFKLRFTKMCILDTALIGTDFVGPYEHTKKPMDSVMKDLLACEELKELRLEQRLDGRRVQFGQYFDDPKVTPKAECRSFVGVALDWPDERDLDLIRSAGFRVKTVKACTATAVTFPMRSMVGMILGIMRTYRMYAKAKFDEDMQSSLEFYNLTECTCSITAGVTVDEQAEEE